MTETIAHLPTDPSRRVVVTGMGAVSPWGLGVDALLEGARSGASAVRPIEEFEVDGLACRVGGRVPAVDLSGFDPRGAFRRAPRASRYAQVAAAEVFGHAGDGELPWPAEEVGAAIGTYRGMTEVSEVLWHKLIESEPRFVPALLFQETVTNAVASAVSIRYGLKGVNYTISVGNSSGFQAVHLACQALLAGRAQAMLAGTFDLFTEANQHDMDDLGMLSAANASRPFDQRRDGFVMGEGAALVLLETLEGARRRGAPVLAEIAGIGVGHDAHAFATNHPDGRGLAAAAGRALAAAGATPGEIGYIGAAANSTPALDLAESRAIRRVFGDAAGTVPLSSLKGATGEAMSASDLFNLIACVGVVRDGLYPVHAGSEQPDPACGGLQLVRQANGRPPAATALAHSYSYFGGSAAAVVIRSARDLPGAA